MDSPAVQYAHTKDGVSIAYAVLGSGPVLVRSLGWFTHLEMEWRHKAGRRFWEEMAKHYTLVRYDGRGVGLSDREVEDFSIEARLLDLQAVTEAIGAERIALMGLSEGGATAVAYAAAHPDQVAALVLYGSFHRFGRGPMHRSDHAREQIRAMTTLVRARWGSDASAFRRMFTNMMVPRGTAEEVAYFDALQRASCSPETAASFLEATYDMDVTDRLEAVQAPALVLHRRNDQAIPFGWGRRLAAGLPGAQLQPLDGDSHQIWVGEQAELNTMIEAVTAFTAQVEITRWDRNAPGAPATASSLTPREHEVLALLAVGESNQGIADALGISRNTVIRHVNNIFNKIDASNRVEATAYAITHGLAG